MIGPHSQRDSHQEQNQRFYKSTVAAIEAQKEAAQLEKTAAKQQPAHRKPAEKPPPIDDDTMRPATPKNPDDTEEISIAGRTKITVPKNRNDPVQQGSESPSNTQADDKISQADDKTPQADDKTPQADDTPKTDDAPGESDAKTELNSILKRAPSTSRPRRIITLDR